MVGDSMVRSLDQVNQGTTAGDAERACRGQSVRSSDEAGNDRGAKGRRKVAFEGGARPSREGRRSAARLFASVLGKTRLGRGRTLDGGLPRNGVSGTRWSARLVRSLRTSRNECLSLPILRDYRPESRMRQIRLSGLGGRGRSQPFSYPHP